MLSRYFVLCRYFLLYSCSALCFADACRGVVGDRCTRRARQEASVPPPAPSVCTDSVSVRSATTRGILPVVGVTHFVTFLSMIGFQNLESS